jgi:SAM-dependent methyltransferase
MSSASPSTDDGAGRIMAQSPRGLLDRAKFWLLEARRGRGRPIPGAFLDAQYRAGYWKHLDEISELAPCMIIAGYVHHLFESPLVLDVGCGHGRMARLLAHFPLEGYTGIDLSPAAIAQARALGINRARFATADFEKWTPPEQYDVILFQDSLYYATDPVRQLRRYAGALTEHGVFVVSMFRYSNNRIIWRRIDRSFQTVAATRVRNRKGKWDVRVLRLRHAPSRDEPAASPPSARRRTR